MNRERNKTAKINNSSMQVLKTLQVLLQGNYTMNEIVEQLNMNEPEDIFNSSVVSKYINTCRFCGIKIPQVNNKYYVASIPFGMELTDEECELLHNLEVSAQRFCAPKTLNAFINVLNTIGKYSNKEFIQVDKETAQESVEIFESAVQEHRKIKIIPKSQNEIECIPIETEVRENKLFFRIHTENRECLYPVDEIRGLEVYNEKFLEKTPEYTVIYKIYGELSKRYQPRPYEGALTDNTSNCLTIFNRGEDRDALLSRLLRYDYLCEVINPKSFRDKMVKTIDDTLANYGE